MTATSIHSRSGIAVSILLAFVLLLALLVALSAATAPVEAQSTIIYVDAAASGVADGSSWDDAFTSVQDAMAVAVDGDEIWVATGIYTPGASVNASFTIPHGVLLYGGFAGDETERDERDWEANPTVLSGDIGGDDVTDARGVVTDTANIVGGNAYHVVMLDGSTTPITASTRLDGVIITAGQAEGDFPDDAGGGLYCNGERAGEGPRTECSPTLTNVTFAGNWAEEEGGAMYNHSYQGESSPTLTNVTFAGNRAGFRGGAMYNDGNGGESSPTLTNVTFAGNWAEDDGGAMYNEGDNGGQSSPTLTNVTFAGNRANENGGAMFNYGGFGQSSPTLTNVTFAGNRANENGGAMYNDGYSGASSPTLTNVTFAGNRAGQDGGVMFNIGAFGGENSPTLTNVILWDNSAGSSGAVMYNYDATPTIAHSLVQGGWNGSGIVNINGSSVTDGGGNIDADPLFVSAVDPAGAPTTDGNLRLQPGSPAIDAGDNSALPPSLTTDLNGNPRIQGGVVDMGAYEFHPSEVALSMAVTPSSAQPGQVITYTLTFSNAGPSVATGVVISDSMPEEVSGVTYQASGVVITQTGSTPYTWQVADLAPGAGGIITLTGVVEPALTEDVVLNNEAAIVATNDEDAANNGDVVTTTVTVPRVRFTNASYSAAEGSGATVITVTLDGPNPYAEVTVHVSTGDGSATAGSDYGVVSQTLTIAAGQTTATIPVPIMDDALNEEDETVQLQLSAPAGAALDAPQTATLTIIDDDEVPPEPEEYGSYLPLMTMP